MKLIAKPLHELLELQPPPFLFEGLIRDNAITQIAADPYSGKTLLMLSMALCCDFHRPLFDQFAPLRNHKVLMIMPDCPDWDVVGMSRKLMLGMGLSKQEWNQTEVQIHTDQDVNILHPEFIESLNKFHAEFGFTVLFIDTLLDVHELDPNSWLHMKQVMKVLKSIRDKFGCAIIFSHHTSKPGPVERPVVYSGGGSGKVVASSDFQFVLRRKGARVNVLFGKQRGQQAEAPLTFYDIMDVEVKGEWGLKLVIPQNIKVEAALAFIAKQPSDRHEIAAYITPLMDKPSAVQALKAADNIIQALRTLGKIRKEGDKWVLKT